MVTFQAIRRRTVWQVFWFSLSLVALPLSMAVADDEIIAAKRSKVYHPRPCAATKNISEENKVRFKSEKEAASEGRRLCKTCAKILQREKDQAQAEEMAKARSSEARNDNKSGVESKGAGVSKTESPKSGQPEQDAAPVAQAVKETPAPATIEQSLTGRVKIVLPGGTLVLENGERIRMSGINCPDAGQMHAEEAAAFLVKETRGRKVRVVWYVEEDGATPRDTLGRLIAIVSCGSDKSDVASEMLLQGLAWVNREEACLRRAEYLNNEDDAAWSQRGVWKRLSGQAGRREAVVGKHTHQYHAPNCPHAAHLIEPATITLNEAKGRRLSPCPFWRDEP